MTAENAQEKRSFDLGLEGVTARSFCDCLDYSRKTAKLSNEAYGVDKAQHNQ